MIWASLPAHLFDSIALSLNHANMLQMITLEFHVFLQTNHNNNDIRSLSIINCFGTGWMVFVSVVQTTYASPGNLTKREHNELIRKWNVFNSDSIFHNQRSFSSKRYQLFKQSKNVDKMHFIESQCNKLLVASKNEIKNAFWFIQKGKTNPCF